MSIILVNLISQCTFLTLSATVRSVQEHQRKNKTHINTIILMNNKTANLGVNLRENRFAIWLILCSISPTISPMWPI